jgi:hypothetical protein
LNIEALLSKFQHVRQAKPNRWEAQCPCHDDKKASLSITNTNDRVLFYCFAGCNINDILLKTGLTFADLFYDSGKPPIAIYQYRAADGSFHHEKLKYKTPDGKRFIQRRIDDDGNILDNLEGIQRIPYHYPDVLNIIKEGSLLLYVEGEKDADTARLLNYTATTMGGASDWKDEYKNYFKNANMVIIPDKDDAGLKLTTKIAESLKSVVKSIKIVILPIGKDLTEWVEAGNHNLQPLIDDANEFITQQGVPEPIVKEVVGGYELYWVGLDLKIIIDHITNEDSAEISVYEKDKPIYISGFKLLSISHKESLARALGKIRKLPHWETIINQLTVKCLSKIRQGESVMWLDGSQGVSRPEYLLPPLFVKNTPNVIYADRSSAKSLFMTLTGIILTLPWYDNPLGLYIPEGAMHRVLFLDWENDQRTTDWQKECMIRGMDLSFCEIAYLHCNMPLAKNISHIQDKINEVMADVIIIDSLGVAVGGNLNDSEPAINFFNALRQLPVTPLIIAHTAKDINNKHKTIYGNAFYENLARSIWEVNKKQEVGSSELTMTLFNRKCPPFANYHEPLGFKFKFDGDKTIINRCEPILDKRESNEIESGEDKVLAMLELSGEQLSVAKIKEALNGEVTSGAVDVALVRLIKAQKIIRIDRGIYVIAN